MTLVRGVAGKRDATVVRERFEVPVGQDHSVGSRASRAGAVVPDVQSRTGRQQARRGLSWIRDRDAVEEAGPGQACHRA
jgi:hypothetical protein